MVVYGYELDYKEIWVLKNRCFWIVVLEKTLEHPLDCKEIQPVDPKGNQSWIFTGRTDAEAETPNFGNLIQRTDSFEKLWCWERLRARWEGDNRGCDGWVASLTQWTWFWETPGVDDRQGGLTCCSLWGHKESDMTEWLNCTHWEDRDNIIKSLLFLYLPQIWCLNPSEM